MDRVKIQIQFRKGIFVCKECGQEDIIDWSMNGGNKYENNCSACGKYNNSFTEYRGCLFFDPEEYSTIKEDDLSIKKANECNKWINERKNPAPYIEPTKEEYLALYNDRMTEVSSYLSVISEKATAEELESIKATLDNKGIELSDKICGKVIVQPVVKARARI